MLWYDIYVNVFHSRRNKEALAPAGVGVLLFFCLFLRVLSHLGLTAKAISHPKPGFEEMCTS